MCPYNFRLLMLCVSLCPCPQTLLPAKCICSSGRGGLDLTVDGCVEAHPGMDSGRDRNGKKQKKRIGDYFTKSASGSSSVPLSRSISSSSAPPRNPPTWAA